MASAYTCLSRGPAGIARDGIENGRIQKCEYCAELFWKYVRSCLQAEGKEVSPVQSYLSAGDRSADPRPAAGRRDGMNKVAVTFFPSFFLGHGFRKLKTRGHERESLFSPRGGKFLTCPCPQYGFRKLKTRGQGEAIFRDEQDWADTFSHRFQRLLRRMLRYSAHIGLPAWSCRAKTPLASARFGSLSVKSRISRPFR